MENEIKKVCEILKNGGVIIYPTDTIWGIGCDATNSKAVEKIYKIKGRMPEKSLIMLVKDVEQLNECVGNVPDIAVDLIKSYGDPLTIIYGKGKGVAKEAMAPDGSVAIRVPRDNFCQEMLKAFGKPIISTSANISGEPAPMSFSKIPTAIKNSVDYVFQTNREVISRPRPSTIIRIQDNGEMVILRN